MPGCKAPRTKTGTITEAKKEAQVMMQMKASSIRLREQCKVGLASGTMPISAEARKAMDDTSKYQNHIAMLEKMEGADTGKLIANYRAEIAKLKPKLPKTFQNLEDQAQALEVIRECRGKYVTREKVLKEQIQKAQEVQQQIDTRLQTGLKEIEDYVKAQKKKFEESAKNRRELH